MTDESITPLVGFGLRVDLTQYDIRRTREGGVALWSTQERQYILKSAGMLGRYLADIREFDEARNSVTFKFETSVSGGPPVEVAGESLPADLLRLRAQVAGLTQALAEFKAQADDDLHQRDPDRWHIVRNLKLPNPKLDPQFYRVYGPFYRRRLLVLWGLERKPAYAGHLTPSVETERAFDDIGRRRLHGMLLLLLLPLLLFSVVGLLLALLGGALCGSLGIGCAPLTANNPLGRARTIMENAQFTVDKLSDTADLHADGSVRYLLKVTNKSETPLTKVEVTDPMIPALLCRFSPFNANSTQQCQARYWLNRDDVAAGRVTNTATATAINEAGETVQARDNHVLTLSADDLERLEALGAHTRPPIPLPATRPGQSPSDAPVPGEPSSATRPGQRPSDAPVPGEPSSATRPGQSPSDAPVPGEPSSATRPGQRPSDAPVPGEPSSATRPGQSPSNAPVPGEPSSATRPGQSPSDAPVPGEPSSATRPGQSPSDAPVPGEPSSATRPGQRPSDAHFSARVTDQQTQGNGLVELQITGFDAMEAEIKSAEWVIEGAAGRRVEVSGNPIVVSLPASPEPYRLTLVRPNEEETTKKFEFPVTFKNIELKTK